MSVKLDTPFLNHVANVRFYSVAAEGDDEAPKKTYRKIGEGRIDDLKSVLDAMVLVSAGGADTLSAKRLTDDRNRLACALQASSATSCPPVADVPGSGTMSPESTHAGVLLLDAYDHAIARASGPSQAVTALAQ